MRHFSFIFPLDSIIFKICKYLYTVFFFLRVLFNLFIVHFFDFTLYFSASLLKKENDLNR